MSTQRNARKPFGFRIARAAGPLIENLVELPDHAASNAAVLAMLPTRRFTLHGSRTQHARRRSAPSPPGCCPTSSASGSGVSFELVVWVEGGHDHVQYFQAAHRTMAHTRRDVHNRARPEGRVGHWRGSLKGSVSNALSPNRA